MPASASAVRISTFSPRAAAASGSRQALRIHFLQPFLSLHLTSPDSPWGGESKRPSAPACPEHPTQAPNTWKFSKCWSHQQNTPLSADQPTWPVHSSQHPQGQWGSEGPSFCFWNEVSDFLSEAESPSPPFAKSLVAQLGKNPAAMWETWVRSLGWEDPLDKQTATHSSILAWRIPWTV